MGQSCTIFWIVQFIELSMPTLYLLYSRNLKSFQSTYISTFCTFQSLLKTLVSNLTFWEVQLEDREVDEYTTRYVVLRTNHLRARKSRIITFYHVEESIYRIKYTYIFQILLFEKMECHVFDLPGNNSNISCKLPFDNSCFCHNNYWILIGWPCLKE